MCFFPNLSESSVRNRANRHQRFGKCCSNLLPVGCECLSLLRICWVSEMCAPSVQDAAISLPVLKLIILRYSASEMSKIATLVCVYDFAFAHRLCGIGEDCHGRIIGTPGDEHRENTGMEVIADEDCDFITPFCM